jgi:phage RecT family recombinase
MSNQIVKQRKTQLNSFLDNPATEKRLKSLFGDEKKASKFKATLQNIALDKSLSNCDVVSIIKSGLAIAEADLPISKSLGLAYIVPFGKEAQPIISYKGWKHLLRRDGILIKAREVYSVDDFRMEFNGFNDKFSLKASERKHNEEWIKQNLIGIWVAVKYVDIEEVENFYIPREKLEQLANLSKSKNSKFSPYNTGFWLEMMFAKAVGYVARKIGVSGEAIGKAIEIENSTSTLKTIDEVDTEENEDVDVFDVDVEDLKEEEKQDDK